VRLPWLAHDEAPGPYITIPQYWFNKTKQHTSPSHNMSESQYSCIFQELMNMGKSCHVTVPWYVWIPIFLHIQEHGQIWVIEYAMKKFVSKSHQKLTITVSSSNRITYFNGSQKMGSIESRSCPTVGCMGCTPVEPLEDADHQRNQRSSKEYYPMLKESFSYLRLN